MPVEGSASTASPGVILNQTSEGGINVCRRVVHNEVLRLSCAHCVGSEWSARPHGEILKAWVNWGSVVGSRLRSHQPPFIVVIIYLCSEPVGVSVCCRRRSSNWQPGKIGRSMPAIQVLQYMSSTCIAQVLYVCVCVCVCYILTR